MYTISLKSTLKCIPEVIQNSHFRPVCGYIFDYFSALRYTYYNKNTIMFLFRKLIEIIAKISDVQNCGLSDKINSPCLIGHGRIKSS